MLYFEYYDETSVRAMPNDNHYGSELQYMIRLKETLVGLEPEECSTIIPNFGMSDDDGYAEKYRKDFDDDVSWVEGHLYNYVYDK